MASLREAYMNYGLSFRQPELNPNKGIGDPTWKERHAKGVPVKMTREEVDKCSKPAKDGYFYCWSPSDQMPQVWVYSSDHDDAPMQTGPDARFCNFRYKPEWLAAKSRKHCKGFVSDHPKTNCNFNN